MKGYEFGWMLDDNKITDITPYISKKYPYTFRIEMIKRNKFVDEALSLNEPEVIDAAIQNKKKPEMYDEWLKHPNALVRRGLAEQGYYPEILIKDKNPKVRYAVATKHLEYFPELLKRKADYKLAWAYIAEHASKINSETYNTILNTTPPANLTKNHQLALKLKKQETSEEVSLLQKTMTTEQLFDMGILESVKELSLYTLLLLANAREIVKTQQLTGFSKAVDKCVKQGNLNIFSYPYEYEKDELHNEAARLLQYVGVLQ